MMTAVVILFIFCWLPIRLLWLIYSFWPESLKIESKFHYYTFVITYFVSHWLAMANSFVNPLIYCFMSQGFRVRHKQFWLIKNYIDLIYFHYGVG